MKKSLKERLNELLLERKLITEEKLNSALRIQKKKGENLGKILIDQGLITEKDLMILLSQELSILPINLTKYKIDSEVIKLIPEHTARQYQLIAISKIGNTLVVAMSDPLNIFAIDELKILTNYEIKPVISTKEEILEAISNGYGTEMTELGDILEGSERTKESVKVIEEGEKIDITEVARESKTAPIVRMVDLILIEGLKKKASDIHIEPGENDLRVRYRIDGNLQEAFTLPKKSQNPILTRLKIMSRLDITESRLPQDGRFKVRLGSKEIDFRVSVLPVSFGGKVVLRALDRSNLSIGLDKLGFLPQPLAAFKQAIAQPYGMILVTGPTGSGKSTTLYSIINQLSTPERNIITIEDPVEYQLEGITQVQANPEIGLTFATGLRSLLRQSPDIIMVGEIRDFETADIAIKASLTGQLVLSTLHTNDAVGAITRLIDMGVEPFLVASSLILVAAQRLCRRICLQCKEPYSIPASALKEVGLKVVKDTTFFHGRGCRSCSNTGYSGRMGTLETLTIDDEIRNMVIKGTPTDEIKQYAESKGMRILRENALEKFIKGMTTLEEVLRITAGD